MGEKEKIIPAISLSMHIFHIGENVWHINLNLLNIQQNSYFHLKQKDEKLFINEKTSR